MPLQPSKFSLAHGVTIPILIFGALLGVLLGFNVYRSIFHNNTSTLEDVNGKFPSILGGIASIFRTLFTGGNTLKRFKNSTTKSGRPPFRIPFLVFFVAIGGILGAFPGFMLSWHMDYVSELEMDLQETLHLRRGMVVFISFLLLAIYYLSIIFAILKSFPHVTIKQKGKLGKKLRKQDLRAKRDEEALKGLLEPNKHHKAVKAYEKALKTKRASNKKTD